ncbi:hypothetical protein GS443_02815 [Rhodococcus hoagii]|nr:hypothetical protein [Prescottella equi]
MTDTITPEEYRVAAKVVGATWKRDDLPCSAEDVVADLEREAARLEAESARDEEAEQLACARRGYMADQYDWMEWPHLSDVVRTAEIDGMRFILDRLAADGRLLPEGAHCPNCLVDLVGVEEAVTPPAVSLPDSGPDGAPEKPWPTAADVPDGAWFRSARNEDWRPRWLRCGNGSSDYADMTNPKPTMSGYQVWHESAVNDFAPFVRVDGDN